MSGQSKEMYLILPMMMLQLLNEHAKLLPEQMPHQTQMATKILMPIKMAIMKEMAILMPIVILILRKMKIMKRILIRECPVGLTLH